MHFAFASDNNYSQHLGVALYTLLKHNSNNNNITIHILSNEINDYNLNKFKEIVEEFKADMIVYDCSDNFIGSKFNNVVWSDRSLATYLRIFLAEIIPSSIDKIIYLDVDSVINGSFYQLWNLDMKNNLIGGVKDIVDDYYKTSIGMNSKQSYVNAGVLLINLKLWRDEGLTNKFIDFVNKKNGKVVAMDQGTINAICNGRVLFIDIKYNMMTPFYMFSYTQLIKLFSIQNYFNITTFNNAKNGAVFIHFVPGVTTRPWIKGCRHPQKDLYINALKETPFKDNELHKDSRKIFLKILDKLNKYLPFYLFFIVYKCVVKASNYKKVTK